MSLVSDPATYIANALSPARVDEVRLMEPESRQTHVVAEDQLSLAIGKTKCPLSRPPHRLENRHQRPGEVRLSS